MLDLGLQEYNHRHPQIHHGADVSQESGLQGRLLRLQPQHPL